MRVIVTRPEPDAYRFAALCVKAGIDPVIAPVMEISFLKKNVDLSGAGALAFTSANGVRAFAANNAERNLPVFSVGSVTAEAAREAGFNSIEIAEGDVASLAALVARHKQSIDGEVLHIAGSSRAGDLIALLDDHGVSARREVLYEARALETLSVSACDAITNDPPAEWAAFFSPRTARIFLALAEKAGIAPRLKKMNAACLSEAVAAEASAVPWRSVQVAKEGTAEGIIALLTSDETGTRA